MAIRLPSIEDLGSLRGKRVLCRVDFNVPISAGIVGVDRRIVRALPTIRELLHRGARVVLMSHLGRPKDEPDPALRLDPVARRLSERLGTTVTKLDECVGPVAEEGVAAMGESGVVLLENLRFHRGEKQNDPEFAAALASLADCYVDDAFGVVHRAHASVVGVPALLPSAAGHLLFEEIAVLSHVRDEPVKPVVLILGGAKVAEKIPLVRNFLDKADRVLIGGGMAYTFLRAAGRSIGASRLEEDLIGTARELMESARDAGIDLLVPEDHACAASLDAEDAVVIEGDVPDGLMGLDIGPTAAARYAEAISGAGTVIWNGPMGVFENPAFLSGSRAVAEAVAALGDGVLRVVGGGDTSAAVEAVGLEDEVGHVSTGGGATLEFLGGSELPGVVALLRE